jgi:MFS family permease
MQSDCFLDQRQNSAPGREHTAEIPVRGHLTLPVVVSIANYMSLAFLDISVNALLPLFFHMPIDMGGVGLDPVTIGYIMGFYGAGTGAFQILFFAKIVRRFGKRRVFVMCIATFVPAFLTFPFISLVARQWGVCMGVWLLVGLFLFMRFFIDTAYGTFENLLSRILINAYSPCG